MAGVKFENHPARSDICRVLGAWAKRQAEVRRVIIYGSRFRGDQKPDSDLDVAVELHPVRDEDSLTTWLCEKIGGVKS